MKNTVKKSFMYIYCSGCGGHFYIGFYRLWLKKSHKRRKYS